jgi:hypothetical protein
MGDFLRNRKGVSMRKSTIFISSVLTTFALVTLYGVVSAYRNISNVPKVSALSVDTATAAPTSAPAEDAAAPTETQTVLTPVQAAQLAAQVAGNSDLLSAESSDVNGTNAYKITFTNNDVVYVGLDGRILSVQIAPVVNTIVVQAPAQHKDKNKNGDNNNTSSGEYHDDGGEHED